MFKIYNEFSQIYVLDLFHNDNRNNFYSLRSQSDFQIPRIPRINITLKGTGSVRYFGAIIWNNIRIEISFKNFETSKGTLMQI